MYLTSTGSSEEYASQLNEDITDLDVEFQDTMFFASEKDLKEKLYLEFHHFGDSAACCSSERSQFMHVFQY